VSIVFRCTCGRSLSAEEEHAGRRVSCPACGGIVIVPTPPAQRGHAIRIDQTELRQTAPTADPVALPPAPPPVASGGPAKTADRSRPHIMKANRRFAGKTCSICQSQVQLGEEIRVCGHCELPFHLVCWEENNGCGTYGCEAAAASGPKQPYADFSVSSGQRAPGCAQVPPPLPAPPQYGMPSQAAASPQVWKSWSVGGKIIFVASCAAVVSMFMAWVDIGILSQSGLSQGAVFFLGLYVYPVVMLFKNKPINKGWGLACSIGSVALGIGYIAWKTVEVFGTVVCFAGSGAWLFLLASIALIVGVAMYAPPGRSWVSPPTPK